MPGFLSRPQFACALDSCLAIGRDLRLGSANLLDFAPRGTRPRESFQESSQVVWTSRSGGS